MSPPVVLRHSFGRSPWTILALALIGGSLSASVTAQTSSSPVSTRATAQAPAVAGDDDAGRTDLMDLLRLLRGAPPEQPGPSAETLWAFAPIIATKPSTGWRFGVGADLEFQMGDPASTRYSNLSTGFTYSTRNQVGLTGNLRVYGRENRWFIDGQNNFSGSSSNNVELGTSAGLGSAPDVSYYSLQLFDMYYYRVARNLYAGGGLLFEHQTHIAPSPQDSPEWDTSPFFQYSAQHGFDPDAQTAAGPAVSILFDNRDNQNDAIRGWYATVRYRPCIKGFLASDSTWGELYSDVRTYYPLSQDKRQKLALWVFGQFVTSGVAPYLALPTSGGDPLGRSARGYGEGRFRGEQLVYGEAEYRALLTRDGLFGLAVFVNLTTTTNTETRERLFDSVAVGGGAGLRVLLHKRSRSNFCVDLATGRDGSVKFYLGLRDAF